MTLTKQAVYLPQKENGNYSIHWNKDEIFNHAVMKEGYFFTPEQLNELLSDVIKDALNTAAENAYVDFEDYDKEFVNKKSITNTFEQTFQKYKV